MFNTMKAFIKRLIFFSCLSLFLINISIPAFFLEARSSPVTFAQGMGLNPLSNIEKQESPANTTRTTPGAETPSTPECSSEPKPRRSSKNVTYPDPPDVYDYEALKQYDEGLYGDKEILKKLK